MSKKKNKKIKKQLKELRLLSELLLTDLSNLQLENYFTENSSVEGKKALETFTENIVVGEKALETTNQGKELQVVRQKKKPVRQPKKEDSDIVDINWIVENLGYTKNTVYQMTNINAIPYLKNKNRLVFSKSELLKWYENKKQKTVLEFEKTLERSSDDYLKISNNLKSFGGGFASALGEALIRADVENTKKLESVFSELFDQYEKM